MYQKGSKRVDGLSILYTLEVFTTAIIMTAMSVVQYHTIAFYPKICRDSNAPSTIQGLHWVNSQLCYEVTKSHSFSN